jgi:hypothetical protein
MKRTVIHVNQHIIKANRASGKREAPLTVKDYKENRKAQMVEINGPSRVVYSPDAPLPCGATVWIETESEVETFGFYRRAAPTRRALK